MEQGEELGGKRENSMCKGPQAGRRAMELEHRLLWEEVRQGLSLAELSQMF